MDSGDTHEPSYYEVALTNRQVLIAFVALLTCLLVAFLSGVWIGRGGEEAAATPPPAATEQAASAEPPLEQLTFFNGSPAAETQAPAAAAPPAAAPVEKAASSPPDASDSLRANLEATMAANRETPAMKLAVGERTGAPAEAPAAPPAAAKAETRPAATAPAAPAARGNVFVQVYSSSNGARAREIVAQLRKAGFRVVLAEAPKGAGRNFRVRVGPYETKSQADADATRLRRDHRLDTWVTDSP
ncbi:MAG: SPOR domain-containing protein [Thermoanaerobaculia bacterium]